MPLRTAASCSVFDVSTRKAPSLALVPRGHLKHATRANKKVAGSTQLGSKRDNHQNHDAVVTTKDGQSPSPPRLSRRQVLNEMLEQAEEQDVSSHAKQQEINSESEDEEDAEDDDQAELRLGERFLNLMALMARLATQSLGDHPAPSFPSRFARTNTERTLVLTRSNTERALSPITLTVAPLSSSQAQLQPIQSPLKSPKHVARQVAEHLPRALQGPLTFDICILLPAPMDDRQSPLQSPIRRKRLRKRVRRRRLRRHARRTWQASHASWPPHASADYIVDHTRQDMAEINATRLVERLGEQKVNAHALPRVLSMPLPPLQRNNTQVQPANPVVVAPVDEQVDVAFDDDHESEQEVYGEEEGEELDNDNSSQSEDEETAEPCAVTTSPRETQEDIADKIELPVRKRTLYHQPAWISPDLHAWLVESGLFATKPRCELLSTGS